MHPTATAHRQIDRSVSLGQNIGDSVGFGNGVGVGVSSGVGFGVGSGVGFGFGVGGGFGVGIGRRGGGALSSIGRWRSRLETLSPKHPQSTAETSEGDDHERALRRGID